MAHRQWTSLISRIAARSALMAAILLMTVALSAGLAPAQDPPATDEATAPSAMQTEDKDSTKTASTDADMKDADHHEEAGQSEEHEHHYGGGFSAARLIEPLGITTLSLMTLTVLLGLVRLGKARMRLKLHKVFGIAALICGATHAIIIMSLE